MYVSIRFFQNSVLLKSSKNKGTSPAFVVCTEYNMTTQCSASHCHTASKHNQCNQRNKPLKTINYINLLKLHKTSTYNSPVFCLWVYFP